MRMRTILDEASSWFLETLYYADELAVIVVEAIRSEEPKDLRIGEAVIKDTYALEPTGSSRKLVVRFPRAIAWQVVDESYTAFDESESRDDESRIQILSTSAYLDYVETHHGWFKDTVGPARHYRLLTEREVIDVVAHDEPTVEIWRDS